MDEIIRMTTVFLLPLYNLIQPDERVFWLYFLAAYLIGLVVYLRAAHNWSPAAVWTTLRRLFPKRMWTHRSAIADYKMWFINNFTYFYLIPLVTISSLFVAKTTAGGLAGLWGVESLGLAPSWTGRAMLTLTWVLAWDLGWFVGHYLLHRIPILWEFHKVHHSAEVMTPITVFRMHPMDDIIAASIVGTLIGLVEGVFLFAYADPVTFYMVNGLNVVWFVFLLSGFHLRHSHIWVMYPKPLRYIFSSPALHQIHHSDDPRRCHKNFARIFVFWDALAGTLHMPKEREEISFGLPRGEHVEYDGIWKIYTLPFKKAAARLLPRPAAKT